MPVYKLQRCRGKNCTLKDEIEKPKSEKDELDSKGKKRKTAGPCRICGGSTYYSKTWHYNLYHKGRKIPVAASDNKLAAEDKEHQAKLDRSAGKLEKKALTWAHGVASLRSTYMIVESCPNNHMKAVEGKPGKPGRCDKCGEIAKYVYRGLSAQTIRMYELCLKSLKYFDSWKLQEIDDTAVQQYKHHRYSTNVGPASVNQDLATISRVLNLSGIKDVKVEKDKVAKRSRYLKPEEFVAFIKAVQSPVKMKQLRKYVAMYTMFTFIVLDTGLRKAAALSLKKSDFDFNLKIVRKEGKGGKEANVKLTDRLITALNMYFNSMEISDSDYLFPSPFRPGQPLKDMRKTHKRIMDLAGINGVTPHDLRRTFGAYFADTTGDLKMLQHLLGHSDIKITNEHYSPFLDGKAAGRMNEFEEKTSHMWSNNAPKQIPQEVPKQELSDTLKEQLLAMGWQPPV